LKPNKKIQPSPIVKICPNRGLRGTKFKQPGSHGDVLKGAITIVPQQRHGMGAIFQQPCTAQDQEIGVTVVIVVAVQNLQAAGDPYQASLGGAIAERAVAVVMKVA